MIQNSL